MAKINPYEPLSKEEMLRQENEKQEIAKRIEAVAKLASECLDDPKFKKYRDEYELLRKDIYDKLKDPIENDPIKDAHYLLACINTIIVLDMLLDKPKKDLKR